MRKQDLTLVVEGLEQLVSLKDQVQKYLETNGVNVDYLKTLIGQAEAPKPLVLAQ